MGKAVIACPHLLPQDNNSLSRLRVPRTESSRVKTSVSDHATVKKSVADAIMALTVNISIAK